MKTVILAGDLEHVFRRNHNLSLNLCLKLVNAYSMAYYERIFTLWINDLLFVLDITTCYKRVVCGLIFYIPRM